MGVSRCPRSSRWRIGCTAAASADARNRCKRTITSLALTTAMAARGSASALTVGTTRRRCSATRTGGLISCQTSGGERPHDRAFRLFGGGCGKTANRSARYRFRWVPGDWWRGWGDCVRGLAMDCEAKPVVCSGMSTPWGKAQSAHVLAPGIGSVSTAGHGGVKVDRAHNAAMPEYMRRAGG